MAASVENLVAAAVRKSLADGTQEYDRVKLLHTYISQILGSLQQAREFSDVSQKSISGETSRALLHFEIHPQLLYMERQLYDLWKILNVAPEVKK